MIARLTILPQVMSAAVLQELAEMEGDQQREATVYSESSTGETELLGRVHLEQILRGKDGKPTRVELVGDLNNEGLLDKRILVLGLEPASVGWTEVG